MEGEKKSSGKMTGIIVGVIAFVAVMVLVIVLVNRGGSINSIAQFREAMIDKKALNCTITLPNGNNTVIQTTNGLKKAKLTMVDPDISSGQQYILIIEGDATYMWDEGRTMAFRMSDSSMLDDFMDEVNTASEEEGDDEGFAVKCESAGKANFAIPDDVDFTEFDDFFGGDYYDDDDYYYDEDGEDYSE